MKPTGKFSSIVFDPNIHAYSMDGIKLMSVTQAISKLKRPFDVEGISQRVAERDGMTVEEVQAEWQQKSRKALDKGSTVHDRIEAAFQEGDKPDIEEDDEYPELIAFKNAWTELATNHKARVKHQEMIIGDSELGIAGTVDMVATMRILESGRTWHVVDHKTGKFTHANRFEKLLKPFSNVMASHLATYSLQASIYRLILERAFPNKRFGESFLIHLRGDGTHVVIQARDFRRRCEAWLLDRKRRR